MTNEKSPCHIDRLQLKLVEDMENKLPEIKEILRKIYAELGLEATID